MKTANATNATFTAYVGIDDDGAAIITGNAGTFATKAEADAAGEALAAKNGLDYIGTLNA